MTDLWPSLLAAAGPTVGAAAPAPSSALEPVLFAAVQVGMVLVIGGIFISLYRVVRGPHLADRVLAADVLAVHVVALVVLLAIRLETAVFYDAALVVAILGFASTLAFAQYIYAQRRGAGGQA